MQPLPVRTPNAQPSEIVVGRDHTDLDVVNVWNTIQGEGPFSGIPATFVRLAGCNIRCNGCDTDYTTNRRRQSVSMLFSEVVTSKPLGYTHRCASLPRCPAGLVVITGGEPFRQNIGDFVRKLLECGYHVQIETNGTLYLEDFPCNREVTVVCSPKTHHVNDLLRPHIGALKYILRAGNIDPQDGLPVTTLGRNNPVARPWVGFDGEVYVQPEDQEDPILNGQNAEAAVASCRKFGYRLCLQVHKIVGME